MVLGGAGGCAGQGGSAKFRFIHAQSNLMAAAGQVRIAIDPSR
jgi:hypothetical protein